MRPRIRRAGAALAVVGGVLVTAGLLAPAAGADNQRISISNYSWSNPAIQLNLGEHVTWYWTGPDLMHSVTGDNPAAAGIDSDPGTNQPQHEIGYNFTATFDQPGTYELRCKLHSTVRGTVTVSNIPGNPTAEPDPIPKNNVDQTPPRLRELKLGASTFGRNGTSLTFSLGERSRVSADIYRYDARGKRHFAGYRTWKSYIGFNGVRLGGRSKHFRPRPGSYLAVISAVDQANNTSTPRRLRFQIRKR
jgi:plastocyanin